jgi:hypothetical protein
MISLTKVLSPGTRSECPDCRKPFRLAILALALICPVLCATAQDENATRKKTPATGNKESKQESGARNVRKPPPPIRKAAVTIKVDPADSKVTLDGQELDTAHATLGLRLAGLKVGPHVLLVRRIGYGEKQQIIELKPGENELVSIQLDPLKGKLEIVPNVSDVSIRIEAAGDYDSKLIGTYADRVTDLKLPPGNYELILSKSGYRGVSRRITIKPDESLFLEPQLSPLPRIQPAPTPEPVNHVAPVPARSRVEADGKYLIVYLEGSSGAASKTVGSINVVTAAGQNTVSGVLSGRPCRVQFIQLENVAESSVVEAPGPSNQWARIVVRLRPKSSKRPVAFAINWTLLENASLLKTPDVPGPTQLVFGQSAIAGDSCKAGIDRYSLLCFQ